MKQENDNFYAGIIAALAVVASYSKPEIYRAIVANVDEAELVDFARRDGAMRWSGLTKHGYGRKYPVPKRNKAEEEATDARLVAVLADALRANEDGARTPHDVMMEAINAQGRLRATWATIPEPRRDRIRRKAMRLHYEGRS